MRQKLGSIISIVLLLTLISSKIRDESSAYFTHYQKQIVKLQLSIQALNKKINTTKNFTRTDKEELKNEIDKTRLQLKSVDIWLRYLEPIAQKKINGPLPVEWETEVFEKFEKPYKREGAGLTLAWLYLDEEEINKDSLQKLILQAESASNKFSSDSVLNLMKKPDHFYFCNRLFLLNLAGIYTTGFDCPNPERVIEELQYTLQSTDLIYQSFNLTFPQKPLTKEYLDLFHKAFEFVHNQPKNFELFNHYSFVRDFVNPLFALNQQFIKEYQLQSASMLDYSLNNNAESIFSKNLYRAQNTKGIYLKVFDEVLTEIRDLGKELFYDPLLSGNNQRSCASCHQSQFCFTDTAGQSNLQFNAKEHLVRNTPSLINCQFNHLLMADGRHLTLQEQLKAVVSNSIEMNETIDNALRKVLSCSEYKKSLKKLLKETPLEREITFEHISSAIIYYYSSFGYAYSPFDLAMNGKQDLKSDEIKGFNLFMSKAQCATCHFVPQFNGVKPPYIGSEFEVLGLPETAEAKKLDKDVGRYNVNPARETHRAFRTGTIRNAERTSPYMHNGIYKTLEQVIEFYNVGGGLGKGLQLNNQTLTSDSLHLNKQEIKYLLAFIKTLNEDIPIETSPAQLPLSKNKKYNSRRTGGEY